MHEYTCLCVHLIHINYISFMYFLSDTDIQETRRGNSRRIWADGKPFRLSVFCATSSIHPKDVSRWGRTAANESDDQVKIVDLFHGMKILEINITGERNSPAAAQSKFWTLPSLVKKENLSVLSSLRFLVWEHFFHCSSNRPNRTASGV